MSSCRLENIYNLPRVPGAQRLDVSDGCPTVLVMVANRPADCSDVEEHDAGRRVAVRMDHRSNSPEVHDSVAEAGFGRHDEMVAGNTVAESRTAVTDGASTVLDRVHHHVHRLHDRLDHRDRRVLCVRYKLDCHSTVRCRCDS